VRFTSRFGGIQINLCAVNLGLRGDDLLTSRSDLLQSRVNLRLRRD
jgi:hypothetical protein